MIKLNSAEINALSVAILHRSLPAKYILDTVHPGIGEDAKIVLDLILGIENPNATKEHNNIYGDYVRWARSL